MRRLLPWLLCAGLLAALAVNLAVPRERVHRVWEPRTHGLLPQPRLASTAEYGEPFNVRVDCEAWSNRVINFDKGARPGDRVWTVCTATRLKAHPVG